MQLKRTGHPAEVAVAFLWADPPKGSGI